MGDIIHIGEGKFEQIRQKYCRHNHLLYNVTEQTVQCKDCNRVINPFQAFMSLVRYWEDATAGLRRRQEEIAALERRVDAGLLKATRNVDHAWRSKKMVPTCPHCHEAIFPEDGFGTSMTNKQMALEARRFKSRKEDK